MGQSLAQVVATLPYEQRLEALEGVDLASLEHDWSFWGRPEQRPPEDDSWHIYVMMSGRGAGKSRSGAEFVRHKAISQPRSRGLLLARTVADARDVMVEGESGLMNIHPPSEMPTYEPSKRRVTWPNGSVATLFSAENPDQLRGPQGDYSWVDELATHSMLKGVDGLTSWDNLKIATRLGGHPQIFVTTTPKRVPVIKEIIDEAQEPNSTTIVVRGSTSDNAGNLADDYLKFIYGRFGGTRLGQQELEGMYLEALEGALWNEGDIDKGRLLQKLFAVPSLRVVAVDPTVAERPGDECGIVVVGSTSERIISRRTGYVLEDASLLGSPNQWAKVVVATARKWNAPVVAEINQGGALVSQNIRALDPNIRVFGVSAKHGKALRAEPISNLYEQAIVRVRHVGYFPDLELQMTNWLPGEVKNSPDRLDALVHGLTALMIKPPKGFTRSTGADSSKGRVRRPHRRLAGVRVGATTRDTEAA